MYGFLKTCYSSESGVYLKAQISALRQMRSSSSLLAFLRALFNALPNHDIQHSLCFISLGSLSVSVSLCVCNAVFLTTSQDILTGVKNGAFTHLQHSHSHSHSYRERDRVKEQDFSPSPTTLAALSFFLSFPANVLQVRYTSSINRAKKNFWRSSESDTRTSLRTLFVYILFE